MSLRDWFFVLTVTLISVLFILLATVGNAQVSDELFVKDWRERRTLDVFNENSCVGCHLQPSPGGIPTVGGFGPRYRSAIITKKGQAHRFSKSGNLDYVSYPFSSRQPPTLFGLGAIALIPPEDIASWAGKRGGVSGKVGNGRFGSKCQTDNLATFIRAAMVDELGVTDATDEEIMGLTAFVLSLQEPRPPQPLASTTPKYVADGKQAFGQIGCADCHRPSFDLPDGRTIYPYSDFLLHDMGKELDDKVKQKPAKSKEWRTAPLWGFREKRGELLHDGRAREIEMAIRLHGGEARHAREAWLSLSNYDRIALKIFVNSL
jgi:CxxC motif-containing protein (DUF1111 family)